MTEESKDLLIRTLVANPRLLIRAANGLVDAGVTIDPPRSHRWRGVHRRHHRFATDPVPWVLTALYVIAFTVALVVAGLAAR